MISGFNAIWVYIIDAFFIIFMFLCFVFIVFISLWPIKMHNIPFAIRSHKITRWAYLMRFKLVAYATFMIISSFYHWYNLYNLSYGCLDCYGTTKNCYLVDKMHYACSILGAFIVAPWILILFLNRFSDKVKYIIFPIILVNILFMFALVVISNISLIWWII